MESCVIYSFIKRSLFYVNKSCSVSPCQQMCTGGLSNRKTKKLIKPRLIYEIRLVYKYSISICCFVICAYFIRVCVRLLQAKSERMSSRKIILFSVSLICIYLYHAFEYLLFNLKRNNIPKFRKRFLDKLRTSKEV